MTWFLKDKAPKNSPAAPTSSLPAASPTLEQSIRSHLAPILREDGFSGSGRTFQRLAVDMILVVQVQGSRSGRSFAVNLGIHPACIPIMGDAPPSKMKPDLCILSRRLTETGGDQWWDYISTKESMDAAITKAAYVYEAVGRPAFEKLVGPSSPLRTVSPQQFAVGQFDFAGFGSTIVMMAKTLALIRLAAGDTHGAQAFARIGLDRLGSALGQLRELRAIDQGIWRKEDW